MPPFRGFTFTSNWEEAQGQTQNSLEGNIYPLWPGNGSGPPRRSCLWGEAWFPPWTCCFCDPISEGK